MNHWIFTVSNHKLDDRLLTAEEIFRQRMEDRFWGLGERTPNRKALQQGDEIVFYLGAPAKCFVGTARLAGQCSSLPENEKEKLSHGLAFYKPDYGVRLEEITVWQNWRPIEGLVQVLELIENKEFWGSYLQGGVRQVTEQDFRRITLDTGDARPHGTPEKRVRIESETEFALESHLEEFLGKNWSVVDFGTKLERYQAEEQDGRQFPAGPWSIDFLCTDKSTGDFIVVELKRGKTSDATVGQILRYMAWVQENLAKANQRDRGI